MSKLPAVVIPVYNEAGTLRGLVEGVLRHVPQVIVVDDGSTDGCGHQLAGLEAVRLSHPRNLGKARALWSGFRQALADGADSVITLDGDGQHRPEDLPRFIEAARTHPGAMILGTRLHEGDSVPPLRLWANRLANWGVRVITGRDIPDTQSGFRLYPASLLRRLESRASRYRGYVFESEVILQALQAGVDVHSIPIPALYSPGLRESHFRPLRDAVQIGCMMMVYLLRKWRRG